MLTLAGLDYFYRALVGDHQGALENAVLRVGNGDAAETLEDRQLTGDQTAERPLDEPPSFDYQYEDDGETPTGVRLVFRASFGEDTANFEWRERAIVAPDGTMIDRTVADQGRKAPGSIWVMEMALSLASPEPPQGG